MDGLQFQSMIQFGHWKETRQHYSSCLEDSTVAAKHVSLLKIFYEFC